VINADCAPPNTCSFGVCAAPGACSIPTPAVISAVTISYGTTGQTMDIYVPTGARSGRMEMSFHGGGYTGGSKTDANPVNLCKALAAVGTVCASPSYTLATANPATAFPAGLKDALCAIRTFRGVAATYGGDPTRMGVSGFSAGGGMAAELRTVLANGYTVPGGAGNVLPHGTDLNDPTCSASLAAPAVGDNTMIKQLSDWYGVNELDPIASIGKFTHPEDPINYAIYCGFSTVASTVGNPAFSAVAADASPQAFPHDLASEVLIHGSADIVVFPALSTNYDPNAFIIVGGIHNFSPLLVNAGNCAAFAAKGAL
jgi:acetyl esterase/lipase